MFNRKQLCALLIPLMLEQILASLMGMADTMMVSNVGSHAIAAVSLVDSLNIVMINLFSAMATGGSIICSQYIGRDDLRQANETARQLLLSGQPIKEVALTLGYNDAKAFSRAFKRVFDVNPGQIGGERMEESGEEA